LYQELEPEIKCIKVYKYILVLFELLYVSYASGQRGNDLLLPTEKELASIPVSITANLEDVFADSGKKDLSRLLPPPLDQGYNPSCVPWVLCYALRSAQEKSIRNWNYQITNGSPDHHRVFSPSFVFNLVMIKKYNGQCTKGMKFKDAFDIISTYGHSFWSDFPYNGDDPGCTIDPLDKVIYGKDFSNVGFERFQPDLKLIRSNIDAGYPVIATIVTDKHFEKDGFRAFKTGEKYTFDRNGPMDGLHAVIIAGYDNSKGLLKLINSYGTEWGDSGYFYIRYSNISTIIRETYISWITSLIANLGFVESKQLFITGTRANPFEMESNSYMVFNDKAMKIYSLGYDSLFDFSVFKLLDSTTEINFVLRKFETKIINLSNQRSIRLSLSGIDTLGKKENFRLEIQTQSYIPDFQIMNFRKTISDDLAELKRYNRLNEKQVNIKQELEHF
jgi:hypothetical protein